MAAAAPATVDRVCPACGTDNAAQPALDYAPAPWRLKRCATCTLVYLENVLDYAALSEDFAWEKLHRAESQRRRERDKSVLWLKDGLKRARYAWRGRKRKIERWVDRFIGSGRLLDIGCGQGKLLARLGPAYQPYGIEISRHYAGLAAAHALPRGGYILLADAVRGLTHFQRGFFDGIVMLSYLEHEAKPAPVLKGALHAMRPGGRLIIKVPNFGCVNRAVRGRNWCGFRWPDHVNYFTPHTLYHTVKAAGFDIIRFGALDHPPFGDNMWLVARKPGGGG